MEQIEIFEIPSPCRGICEVNNRGYCKGCFRSREERFHWHALSEQQKRKVIELCAQRQKRVMAAKKRCSDTQPTDRPQHGDQEDLF
ncbi:DUF1289 domain-containing protein [Pseudoalteromonas sp. OOF1S-7]|uniref:DUF1289 domain-containing protein n=1 Tax=Pseudoalteromonas sp. OOF1S-7 TaxID=2917757 RepID=UPI001EF4C42E|nr:DUF1289 domain-containing protein [Pseudoalteromonas sp. OOF1S-7]MCG7534691.1 DUF1289 domain-containing protein [Pseudoalteromonas sp. OOF1S-7]